MGWYDDILRFVASRSSPLSVARQTPRRTPRGQYITNPRGTGVASLSLPQPRTNMAERLQNNFSRYAQPSPTAGGPLSPVRPNFLLPTRTAPRTNAQGRLNSASFQPVPEAVFTPVSQAIVGPRKEGDVLGPIVDGVSNERFRPVPPVEGRQLTEAQRQLRARAREANAPPSMAPILRSVARGDGQALVNNLLKAGVGAFKGQVPDISRSVASAKRVADSVQPAIDQLSGNAPTITTSAGRRVNVAPGSAEAKAMAAPVSAVAIDPFGRRTGGYTDSRAFTDEPGAISLSAVQGANAAPVVKSAKTAAVPRPVDSVPTVPTVSTVPSDAPGGAFIGPNDGRWKFSGPNEPPVIEGSNMDGAEELNAGIQDTAQAAAMDGAEELNAGIQDTAQAAAKDPVQEPVDEKSFLDNEWVRLGLNITVAASKPGATALGAFGEGALATISDRDKRDAINETRKFRREMAETEQTWKTRQNDKDRAFQEKKLKADSKNDLARINILREKLGLQKTDSETATRYSDARISALKSDKKYQEDLLKIKQTESGQDYNLAITKLQEGREQSKRTLASSIYRASQQLMKEYADSMEKSGDWVGKTKEYIRADLLSFQKSASMGHTDSPAIKALLGGDGASLLQDLIKRQFPQYAGSSSGGAEGMKKLMDANRVASGASQ